MGWKMYLKNRKTRLGKTYIDFKNFHDLLR